MFPLRVRPAKYDKQFTGREPSSLTERVKRAAEEQNRSVNEVRVTFQEIGAAVYEWTQAHAVELLPGGAGREVDDLVVELLNEAVASREKKGKR
jgi:hypothetical protein